MLSLISRSGSNGLFLKYLTNSLSGLVVSIFGQYHFTELLLADRLGQSERKRRYGSLFGAMLLFGLAVLGGSLLLLLPGLFLAARWQIATPFIVCEGMGAVESLRASWHATAKTWLPISGVVALLLLGLGGFFVGLVAALAYGGVAEDSMWLTVPMNLVMSVYTVVGWIAAAGIYRLAVPAMDSLSAVFD